MKQIRKEEWRRRQSQEDLQDENKVWKTSEVKIMKAR